MKTTSETSSEQDLEQASEEGHETECLEPWPEFLTRCARQAEEKLEDVGQEEWLDQWRRKQWRWAAKVVHSAKHKWTYKTMLWKPELHSNRPASRAQRRPKKRWSDDFCQFLEAEGVQVSWMEAASSSTAWHDMEDSFEAWAKF